MKKGWLAVGLLAGMVVLSLWHVSALGALTADLGEQLRRAEALAEGGDWDKAEELTRAASEQWDGRAFYLHVTLDHKTADEMDEAAHGAAQTAGRGGASEFGESTVTKWDGSPSRPTFAWTHTYNTSE